MTTAVDTNILIDVLSPGAHHGDASAEAVYQAAEEGLVIVGEAVYSELAARFTSQADLDSLLDESGIAFEPSSAEALFKAGQAWRRYLDARPATFLCSACGAPSAAHCQNCGALITRRQHALPDFMIGAHALIHAGRLLTRDRGYYRTYFPDLVLV